MKTISVVCLICSFILFSASFLPAQDAGQDLAQTAANPLANMINLPFQNNTNFGLGQYDRTQNILNIQPVIPLAGGRLITRTIFPVVWIPDVTAETGMAATGLGDTLFTAWYVPPSKSKMTLGGGLAVSIPTGGEERGSQKWSLGPSVVVLTNAGPWTIGFLVNNIWSVAGDAAAADVNQGLFQYFFTLQLGGGLYVNTAPLITVNWEAPEGQQWTVPFGAGIGKLFRVGKLPINTQIGAYYNVVKPDSGADWQLRVQVQLMFVTN